MDESFHLKKIINKSVKKNIVQKFSFKKILGTNFYIKNFHGNFYFIRKYFLTE